MAPVPPYDPVLPVAPVFPLTPESPVKPDAPVAPVGPRYPDDPVEPVAPTKPGLPGTPGIYMHTWIEHSLPVLYRMVELYKYGIKTRIRIININLITNIVTRNIQFKPFLLRTVLRQCDGNNWFNVHLDFLFDPNA